MGGKIVLSIQETNLSAVVTRAHSKMNPIAIILVLFDKELINYMNHFSDEGDGCGDVSMFFPSSYYDTTSPNWNKAIQQFQWNDVIHWEQYGW